MDGILIIDKPEGLTSHDVVARVRRALRTKRVGHTGTLDPFATGVMVILIGKATRLAQFLDKDKKEYIADVQFGFETDTGDRTGLRILDRGLRSEEIAERLEFVTWNEVFAKFRGEILQTPPMYSAKKIEGKKLYELARQGIEVEREPIKVVIHELELLPQQNSPPYKGGVSAASADGVVLSKDVNPAIRIRVVCSAGTYIRTLAEDIGREVGLGAHVTNLRRTAAGRFDLSKSVSLEDLQSSTPELLPIDVAVSHLAQFQLNEDRVEKTKSGLSTRVDDDRFAPGEHIRMTSGDGDLVAIGIYDADEKAIRPKVVLI
jgi:tRNA pseudouridine55 synthase